MVETAEQVLRQEFPDLAETLSIHLPDDSDRRFGLAVTAASLP